jgi:hypothetical protein
MSEAIDRFAEAAKRFCQWCESPPVTDTVQARKLLAEIYGAALSLPEGNSDFDTTERTPGHEALSQLAGLPFHLYNVFFIPSNLDESPCMGDLVDDFQDIYRDLRSGLALYDLHQPEAAAWTWLFSFRTHWGHHAASALFALEAHEA